MATDLIFELLAVVGALIGTYVKMSTEISKLQSRIITLEQSKDEISEMLKTLHKDLGEIKLLLARKQLDT